MNLPFFFSPPPLLLAERATAYCSKPDACRRHLLRYRLEPEPENGKKTHAHKRTHTPVGHVGTVPRSLNPSPALRQAAQDATLATHTFERHGYTIGKSQMTVTTSQQTGITTESERLPPGCGLPLSAVTVTDGVAAVAAGQVR